MVLMTKGINFETHLIKRNTNIVQHQKIEWSSYMNTNLNLWSLDELFLGWEQFQTKKN